MKKKHSFVLGVGLAATLLLLTGTAMAGTGGNAEFGPVYTMLEGWFQGTLGKIVALSAMGVGLAWGVVKQSIMAVVLGVGSGLSVYYGPTIVDNLVVAAMQVV
jgi:conjugal transfer pilus assembly protein TraA